jgi:hypothetical protein
MPNIDSTLGFARNTWREISAQMLIFSTMCPIRYGNKLLAAFSLPGVEFSSEITKQGIDFRCPAHLLETTYNVSLLDLPGSTQNLGRVG